MGYCLLPLIIDIKRNSLEDGPGIRSVVFFKGCPLRCLFCHNPEAQDPEVEIAFFEGKCIRCGKCAEVCPLGAIDLEFPGRIDRDRCDRCGRCVQVCPGQGLRQIGAYYPVPILAELLLRDLPFYRHSGGGVTLSGGECTLYPDYLEALLRLLKAQGVHIVLETSGFFDYETFRQKILPFLDLIFFDLKIADPEAHVQYVGQSNKRILGNFRRLLREGGVEIHPRIPLIPGLTTIRENLAAWVQFLRDAGAKSVSLLPYNPLGLEMTGPLGKPRPALPERFLKPEEEREIQALLWEILGKGEKNGSD